MLAESRLCEDVTVIPEEMQAICGPAHRFVANAWIAPMLDGFRSGAATEPDSRPIPVPSSSDADGTAFDAGLRLASLRSGSPVRRLAGYPFSMPSVGASVVIGQGSRPRLWNVAAPGTEPGFDLSLSDAISLIGSSVDNGELYAVVTPTSHLWRTLLAQCEQLDAALADTGLDSDNRLLRCGLGLIATADRNPSMRVSLAEMLNIGWTIGTTPERQSKLAPWLAPLGIEHDGVFNRRIAAEVMAWMATATPPTEKLWGPIELFASNLVVGAGRGFGSTAARAFHVYAVDASSIWLTEEDYLSSIEDMLWDDPIWQRRGIWTGDVVAGRLSGPAMTPTLRSAGRKPARLKRDQICRIVSGDEVFRARLVDDMLDETGTTMALEAVAAKGVSRSLIGTDVLLTPKSSHPSEVLRGRFMASRNLRARTWLSSPKESPDPISRRAPMWVGVLAAGAEVGSKPTQWRGTGHPGDRGR